MTEFESSVPDTKQLYDMLKMQFANLSENDIKARNVPETMIFQQHPEAANLMKNLADNLDSPEAFSEFYIALKPVERRAFLEAAKAALPQDTLSFGLGYRNANRQAALERAAEDVGDIAEIGAAGTTITLEKLAEIAEANLESVSNASSRTTEPLEYDFDDLDSLDGSVDDIDSLDGLDSTERFDSPEEGLKAAKGSRFKIPEIKIPKIELPKVPNLGIMDRVRGAKKAEVVQKPNKILDAPEGEERILAAAMMVQRNFRGKLGRDQANKAHHPMRLADVAKAAGKDNAKQLSDALMDSYTNPDAFAVKLSGLRVTDEFVAKAEKQFVFDRNAGLRDLDEQGRANKAALTAVYSEVLRQDILYGTVSQEKLKKYQEVLRDLNNVQINGQPIMHYATAQAMESGNNLLIGQLVNAGVKVDTLDTKRRTALQAMIADKGDMPLKAPKDRYFDRAARALLYSGASAVGVVTGAVEKSQPNAGIRQYVFELSRPMVDSKASSLAFKKDQAIYKASVSALETGKTTKKRLGAAAEATRKGLSVVSGQALVGLAAGIAGVGTLGLGGALGVAGVAKSATGVAVTGGGAGFAIAGAGVALTGGIVYAVGRIAVSSTRLIEDMAGGVVRGARLAGSHMFDSLGSFKNQRINLERQLKKIEKGMSEEDVGKVTEFSSKMSQYIEAIKAGKSSEELKPIKQDLDQSFGAMKKIQTTLSKDDLASSYSEFVTSAKDADRALKKIYSRKNLREDDRTKHNEAAYKVLVGYASEFTSASAGVAVTGLKIATHQKGGEILPKLRQGYDFAKSTASAAVSSVTGKSSSKQKDNGLGIA